MVQIRNAAIILAIVGAAICISLFALTIVRGKANAETAGLQKAAVEQEAVTDEGQ